MPADVLVLWAMFLGSVQFVCVCADSARDDLPWATRALFALGFSPDRSLSGGWLLLTFGSAFVTAAGLHGLL